MVTRLLVIVRLMLLLLLLLHHLGVIHILNRHLDKLFGTIILPECHVEGFSSKLATLRVVMYRLDSLDMPGELVEAGNSLQFLSAAAVSFPTRAQNSAVHSLKRAYARAVGDSPGPRPIAKVAART